MALYFGNKKSKIYSNNTSCGLNLYFDNIGEASGNDILISNSAQSQLLNTKIYGKTIGRKSSQLFDASLFPTKTIGNTTVTNNGDGSFTISGSGALSSYYVDLYMYTHEETIQLLKPGMFYANFGTITYPCITYYLEDKVAGKSLTLAQNGWGTTAAVNITEDILYSPDTKLVVGFAGDAGATIISGTTKPMMYQDGDGTWEAFTGVSSSETLKNIGNNEGKVELYVKSPQLFDTSKISSFSQGGATITNNGDGSFTITGSGNLTSDVGVDYRYSHEETVKLLKAGNVYSNYSSTSNPYLTFYLVNGGWNVLWTLPNYSETKPTAQVITEAMLNNPNLELLVAIYGDAGVPIKPGTVKPMIYQDGDGTWQPFDLQSHTASVGDGLNGIPLGTTIPETIANSPIHMSGVYFEDGQYWIGDTVDYGNKTLIRRVSENPTTIQDILEVPTVTLISESELQSYNSLHSCNGLTVINNDCDAFMYTKYFKK